MVFCMIAHRRKAFTIFSSRLQSNGLFFYFPPFFYPPKPIIFIWRHVQVPTTVDKHGHTLVVRCNIPQAVEVGGIGHDGRYLNLLTIKAESVYADRNSKVTLSKHAMVPVCARTLASQTATMGTNANDGARDAGAPRVDSVEGHFMVAGTMISTGFRVHDIDDSSILFWLARGH